jgi:hypothetical protein
LLFLQPLQLLEPLDLLVHLVLDLFNVFENVALSVDQTGVDDLLDELGLAIEGDL